MGNRTRTAGYSWDRNCCKLGGQQLGRWLGRKVSKKRNGSVGLNGESQYYIFCYRCLLSALWSFECSQIPDSRAGGWDQARRSNALRRLVWKGFVKRGSARRLTRNLGFISCDCMVSLVTLKLFLDGNYITVACNINFQGYLKLASMWPQTTAFP